MSRQLAVTTQFDPDQMMFERGGLVDEDTFMRVFVETVDLIEREGIPYALIGGLASASMGRPRWTHDIDIFVEPQNARRVIDALSRAGYQTQETYPDWLFKGLKDEVLVDVIFRSVGGIVLDEEMLSRTKVREFMGKQLSVVSPAALLVIKAVVHDEHQSRHWFDALGIIAAGELDWDYLLQRARQGARRVLSLLIYAQSNDLIVPANVIDRLFEMVYRE
jgi:putative nucleotidyltransferase-like protein